MDLDDELDRFWRTQAEPIAPGVVGVIFDDRIDGALLINYLGAETEGSGDVGRYLDALPKDRTVRVIAVTSQRLDGMLVRRGFRAVQIMYPLGDPGPAHVRRAESETP